MNWIDRKKLSFKIGVVLGSLHFLLFLYVVYLINFSGEPDWPMYWFIFFYVDFPISLVSFGIPSVFSKLPFALPPMLSGLSNALVPTVLFGILGTVWYLVLPIMLENIWCRLFQRKGGRT